MNRFFLIIFAALLTNTSATYSSELPKDAKIYVAGHKGLVGSAIYRALSAQGYTNIITKTSTELDLRSSAEVNDFFERETPEYVFLAAAKVGGIYANWTLPADFIFDNLMIETNVIHASYKYGVKKLLFLGSSCIYPRDCPQPIKEEYLLSGPLEKTNNAYAIAKIAGIMMCQAYNKQHNTKFISCMPTNLYGPGDNFDPISSHAMAALIRKFIEAKDKGSKQVTVWGTGTPMREFLHVDDLASACVYLMNYYEDNEIINVGCGTDISIGDLSHLIKSITKYEGEIIFDTTMPDGAPKKLLDISKIQNLGWSPTISLEQGIEDTIHWYQSTISEKK